jgi:CubicO group peptidase (beta-lactamase class C family)
MVALAGLLVATLAGAGQAQPTTPDLAARRAHEAFAAWIAANRVGDASLAISRKGEIVGAFGYGRRKAEDAAPVASLSKAITAACAGTLVDAGRLEWSTPLAAMLGAGLAAADPRAGAITLAQLVTHTSGLGLDATQKGGLAGLPNDAAAAAKALAARSLGVPLARAPGSGFAYNNTNYALLGLVIEATSGETYEDYCRRALLVPAGAVGARLNPGGRAMGAFGGWEISAPEYLRLARILEGASLLYGPKARTLVPVRAGEADYGPGLRLARGGSAAGRQRWHFGSWVGPTSPRELGAYFALLGNGLAVAATWDRNVPEEARRDLAGRLDAALLGKPPVE